MSAYAICVWIHVVAATAWVGSMIFFSLVVVPVVRRPELRSTAAQMIAMIGARYRRLGWVALGTLIVTGAGNLYFRGLGWSFLASRRFWSTAFGAALGWKLVLVASVLALTTAHDVSTRRRIAHPADRDSTSADALRARRIASWLGRTVLAASLLILFFATALVRGFL